MLVCGEGRTSSPVDLVALRAEHAHERLAQVAGAAGDEDAHRLTVAGG